MKLSAYLYSYGTPEEKTEAVLSYFEQIDFLGNEKEKLEKFLSEAHLKKWWYDIIVCTSTGDLRSACSDMKKEIAISDPSLINIIYIKIFRNKLYDGFIPGTHSPEQESLPDFAKYQVMFLVTKQTIESINTNQYMYWFAGDFHTRNVKDFPAAFKRFKQHILSKIYNLG